jgi:hypothetical protein
MDELHAAQANNRHSHSSTTELRKANWSGGLYPPRRCSPRLDAHFPPVDRHRISNTLSGDHNGHPYEARSASRGTRCSSRDRLTTRIVHKSLQASVEASVCCDSRQTSLLVAGSRLSLVPISVTGGQCARPLWTTPGLTVLGLFAVCLKPNGDRHCGR